VTALAGKIGLGVAALVLAVLLTFVAWQDRQIKRQEETIRTQAEDIGILHAANASLDAALGKAKAARDRDNALVAEAAQKIDTLTARARLLDRRLKEALRDDQEDLSLDAPLPPGVSAALCLRYRAARGLGDSSPQGDSSGCAAAGTDHSPTAACGGWEAVTLRDALEWIGPLLDHAGAERLDKEALRVWAAGFEGGEKE
jgi:hypothetical protein